MDQAGGKDGGNVIHLLTNQRAAVCVAARDQNLSFFFPFFTMYLSICDQEMKFDLCFFDLKIIELNRIE